MATKAKANSTAAKKTQTKSVTAKKAAPAAKNVVAKKAAPAAKKVAAKKAAPAAKKVATKKAAPAAKKSTPAKAAPKGVTTKRSVPSTEFTVVAPDAKNVYLAGEFNNWNVSEFPMRRYKNGLYKKSLKLTPGRYEYQFIVDGNWWTDPKNSERVLNSFGTENSVLNINK